MVNARVSAPFKKEMIVGLSSRILLAILVALYGACESRRPDEHGADPAFAEQMKTNELLLLSVPRGAVIMAGDGGLVPVDSLEPTCIVPIVEGIDAYANVGWVSPRFFLVRANETDPGYRFQPLRDGRERFTARFRVPLSEGEAIQLNGRDHIPRGANGLFCNVSATLAQVAKRTPVRRLAIWPLDDIRASMKLGDARRIMAVQRGADWTITREVAVSLELSTEEAQELRRAIETIGREIDFDVSSRWRRAACFQRVDFSGVPGIDAYGLREGESGAVALGTIKAAVRRLVSRDTRVKIEGECGGAELLNKPRPGDETETLSCTRNGESLGCVYEGGFSDEPTTFRTPANIGGYKGADIF